MSDFYLDPVTGETMMRVRTRTKPKLEVFEPLALRAACGGSPWWRRAHPEGWDLVCSRHGGKKPCACGRRVFGQRKKIALRAWNEAQAAEGGEGGR